jgi:hypothetical protein
MLLVGKPERKRQLRRQRCRKVVILRWLFEEGYGMVLTGLVWLRIRTSGGLL